MIHVNGCLRAFSIFGDTFLRSGKKRHFESEKKEARTVFYIFLTFSWRIDASVNHINGFSSIFAANIRSRLFSANDNKCKPGLRLCCKVIFENENTVRTFKNHSNNIYLPLVRYETLLNTV